MVSPKVKLPQDALREPITTPSTPTTATCSGTPPQNHSVLQLQDILGQPNHIGRGESTTFGHIKCRFYICSIFDSL